MSTISADTTVGEQAQSTAEDFAVEFADIHASFEKRSAGPLSIPLGDRNTRRVVGAGLASVAPFIAGVTSASAKGGAYGIVEGRTASFLHPTIMVRKRMYNQMNTTQCRTNSTLIILQAVVIRY